MTDSNSLPLVGTKKYFEHMKKQISLIEKSLPISVYGFSGYSISFYWLFEDGERYAFPNQAPLKILEGLLSK